MKPTTLEQQEYAERQYADAVARTLVMIAEGLANTGMTPDQAANVITAGATRAVAMFCKRNGVAERTHADA